MASKSRTKVPEYIFIKFKIYKSWKEIQLVKFIISYKTLASNLAENNTAVLGTFAILEHSYTYS